MPRIWTREERARVFWEKVDIGDSDDCWPYKGAIKADGYGSVRFEKRYTNAHRIAWMLTSGGIPYGLFVCHHCDNPPCCNPNHLFLGTNSDNLQDAKRKGRLVNSGPKGMHVNVGSKNGAAKLTEDQVREIRELSPHFSFPQLANRFGVSRSAICLIVNRNTWKHVTAEENQ